MSSLSNPKKGKRLSLFFLSVVLLVFSSFFIFSNKIVNASSVIFGTDPENGDFIVKVDGVVKLRITSEGVLTVGKLNSTIEARDISSGEFGSNKGGGEYSFPGNVGVGTTGPSTALDVTGSVKADNIHPISATLWPDEMAILAGSFSYTSDGSQVYGGYWQSDDSDGATLEGSFFLKSGSHTMYVLGESDKNYGKIDWYIDDSLVVEGQDWYSSSRTRNVRKSENVTIVNDGVHTLKAIVNGKNPGSNSYRIRLTKIWLNTANPAAITPSAPSKNGNKTELKTFIETSVKTSIEASGLNAFKKKFK